MDLWSPSVGDNALEAEELHVCLYFNQTACWGSVKVETSCSYMLPYEDFSPVMGMPDVLNIVNASDSIRRSLEMIVLSIIFILSEGLQVTVY